MYMREGRMKPESQNPRADMHLHSYIKCATARERTMVCMRSVLKEKR